MQRRVSEGLGAFRILLTGAQEFRRGETEFSPQVYIRGQEEQYEYEDHDFEFCGKDQPQTVQTPGPRLVLLFNAGSRSGSGFKARFRFETEYLIPIGTPAPNGSCHFTYRSMARKQGIVHIRIRFKILSVSHPYEIMNFNL